MTQNSRNRKAAFQVSQVIASKRCISAERGLQSVSRNGPNQPATIPRRPALPLLKRTKDRAPSCAHGFFPSNDDNFSSALARSAGAAGDSGFGADASLGPRSACCASEANFSTSTTFSTGALTIG